MKMFTERFVVLAAAAAGGGLTVLAGALFVALLWALAMLAFLCALGLFFLAAKMLPHSVKWYREVPGHELMEEPEELFVDKAGPFGWMRPQN